MVIIPVPQLLSSWSWFHRQIQECFSPWLFCSSLNPVSESIIVSAQSHWNVIIPQRGLTLNVPALHAKSHFSVIVTARWIFPPLQQECGFFFLVSCFKQVKAEVPPSNRPREKSWGLLGDGEEIGKKESWGFEFWKEKIVHKLIEMSQDFMDLHNDRPTRNRNTSVLVCRGSAHPAFCIFPISASSLLKLQCQGKQMLTPCTNWHYKVRIRPTLLQAKKLFPMPLPKTWRILNQA